MKEIKRMKTKKLLDQGLSEEEFKAYKSYSRKIDTLIRAGDYEKYVDYVLS